MIKKEDSQSARSSEAKAVIGSANIKMSNISLILDDYNDIFSDFDPRPYDERALSQDFINEAIRASRDKVSGQFELKLIMPKRKRNLGNEEMIKKRLHEHFRKHHHEVVREAKIVRNKGLLFIFAGVSMMLTVSISVVESYYHHFWLTFMKVLLEPAGWFLIWEGLNQVVFDSKKNKLNIEFYDKMSKCDIHFIDN